MKKQRGLQKEFEGKSFDDRVFQESSLQETIIWSLASYSRDVSRERLKMGRVLDAQLQASTPVSKTLEEFNNPFSSLFKNSLLPWLPMSSLSQASEC
jgi:hypothetical protein